MEYALFVKLRVSVTPPFKPVFTSSIPPVMLPLPSATNTPTRPKNPPASVPLIRHAYWPFRSALLKPPTGGGGTGTDPPPLQAAANAATQSVSNRVQRLIAGLPAAHSTARLSCRGCR